tara:strand:+ start:6380 stop:7051 length:672 start_codon:yes stop_codon:yes gene_type:complete
MNKQGNILGWFILIGIMLVLVGLFFFYLHASTSKIEVGRTIVGVDEKPSFSTYVESAYDVATECYLKRIALNDAELRFTNMHPNSIPEQGHGFIEVVIDEVFQNFTIFQGRGITKDQSNPKIVLREDRVDVQIDQKFSIKVDNQDHRITKFISSIPIRFKQMLALRNAVLNSQSGIQANDIELNQFYQQPFNSGVYQRQGRTVIDITDEEGPRNQDMKFLFVK